MFGIFGLILLAALACVNGHGATSYANIHQYHSGHVGYGGERGQGGYDGHHHMHYPHHIPHYKYEYGVDDHHTGDHKKQWEIRHGDQVKGGYSFKEADGTTRIVEYTSDKHNGFQAIVKRIGHAVHPKHYSHGHAGNV